LTPAAVTATVLVPAAAPTKAGAATCAPPAGQLLVTPGVAATTRPDGNVSVKLKPVRAELPVPVLLMVNVSTAVPPPPIVAKLNAFVSAGSAATVKPLDVTLLVRFVVVTLAVVLLYGPPATLLVTLTVTVHVAWPAFMVPAENEITPLPALAPIDPAGQVVPAAGVAATTTLVGKVSTKPKPVCAGLPAPLVMVKVNTEVPPISMAVGANALLMDACTTARFAVAAPTPATGVCVVTTPLVVFGNAALTVALVTGIVTVQVAPTGSVKPEIVIAPV
jgi:hypothetical protein